MAGVVFVVIDVLLCLVVGNNLGDDCDGGWRQSGS